MVGNATSEVAILLRLERRNNGVWNFQFCFGEGMEKPKKSAAGEKLEKANYFLLFIWDLYLGAFHVSPLRAPSSARWRCTQECRSRLG